MCSEGKYNLLPGCVACDATVDTDCTKCAIGSASNAIGRNSTCDACVKGTYSHPARQSGATLCVICPNGTFSLDQAGECTECPLGWWALEGSSKCTACPRDTYLDTRGKGTVDACLPCPKGSISSRIGNPDPECNACPPGTYSADGECIRCAPGSYSKSGSTACSGCQQGTYSESNATVCVVCNIGTYSPNNYSSTCTPCGTGAFSSISGASTCMKCLPGSAAAAEGLSNCSSCNPGEFAASGASQVLTHHHKSCSLREGER